MLNFTITACDQLQVRQIVIAAGVFVNGAHVEFSAVNVQFQTALIGYYYKLYPARSK